MGHLMEREPRRFGDDVKGGGFRGTLDRKGGLAVLIAKNGGKRAVVTANGETRQKGALDNDSKESDGKVTPTTVKKAKRVGGGFAEVVQEIVAKRQPKIEKVTVDLSGEQKFRVDLSEEENTDDREAFPIDLSEIDDPPTDDPPKPKPTKNKKSGGSDELATADLGNTFKGLKTRHDATGVTRVQDKAQKLGGDGELVTTGPSFKSAKNTFEKKK